MELRSSFLASYGTSRPVARTEYVLAVTRAFLATALLIAIYIDPTEPTRFVTLVYSVLAAYVLYSLALLAAVQRAQELQPWHSRMFHGIDVAWACVLTSVSDGPMSPFYLHFLFVALSAAYRWGLIETMVTVLVMLVVFLGQVAAALIWPGIIPGDLEWNRVVSRIAYLLITGYVAGFLSEQNNGLRAEMAAVADAIHQARVELGLGGSVSALATLLLKIFDAAAIDVVLHERNTDRALLWHLTAARNGTPPTIHRRELPSGDEERWFFEVDAMTWHAPLDGAATTRGRAVQAGAWPLRTVTVEVPTDLLSPRFKTVTVTNVGLDHEWRGRIFLYDLSRRGALARRLHFLESLTAHLTPSLTNIVLMRRLRSQAGAAERARVARELHDGTIQALFGIEMKLEALRRGVVGNAVLVEGLEDVQLLLRAEILGMRELMQALRPVELDAVHQLPDVLASVVERFRRDSGVSARFVSNLDRLQLTPAASIEVVRIVQEALANVRKHSRARNVLVRFTGEGDAYTLTVEDDGRGFDFSGSLSHDQLDRAHVGPAIIKERARLLGGHVTVESTPGEGARIEITFGAPVHA